MLKYKTAPIPSFRRRPESRRAHSVIPAQAGIQAGPFRHSGAGRNPGGSIPSFRRRPESRRAHSAIPAQAGIQAGPFRHSGAGRNPGGPIPSFRRRPESGRAHSVIPAQAGIQAGPLRHSGAGRNPGGSTPSFRRRPESRAGPLRHSGVGRNPGVVGLVRSYNLNFTYPYQLSHWGEVTGDVQCVSEGRVIPRSPRLFYPDVHKTLADSASGLVKPVCPHLFIGCRPLFSVIVDVLLGVLAGFHAFILGQHIV